MIQKMGFSVLKKMVVLLKKIHIFSVKRARSGQKCCGKTAVLLYCCHCVAICVAIDFPYFSMVFSVYGTVEQRKAVIFTTKYD